MIITEGINTASSTGPAAGSKAWVITGPTSGIGYHTALELAEHGTVVLAGRDRPKLREVEDEINAQPGGHALSVVADFSDVDSVRAAADEIVAMSLPIAGVLNNAGMMGAPGRKTARAGTSRTRRTTSARSPSSWCSLARASRTRSAGPPSRSVSRRTVHDHSHQLSASPTIVRAPLRARATAVGVL